MPPRNERCFPIQSYGIVSKLFTQSTHPPTHFPFLPGNLLVKSMNRILGSPYAHRHHHHHYHPYHHHHAHKHENHQLTLRRKHPNTQKPLTHSHLPLPAHLWAREKQQARSSRNFGGAGIITTSRLSKKARGSMTRMNAGRNKKQKSNLDTKSWIFFKGIGKTEEDL